MKASDYVNVQEAARLLGVSAATLRRYDAAGIIVPARNPANGYRIYTRAQIAATLAKYSAMRPPEERAGVAAAAVEALKKVYGSPRLGNKDDPLDELFYIMMSLRTTYWSFERTFDAFAARYRPWDRLLSAKLVDVAAALKEIGFSQVRARTFIQIAKTLSKSTGAVSLGFLRGMPREEAERALLALPGVGTKTARCVMMYSLGHDIVPVDTHTARVATRVGLVPPQTSEDLEPLNAEFDAVTPAGLAYDLHTNFVAHGREVCTHRSPACERCVVLVLCASGPLLVGSRDDGGAPRRPAASQRKARREEKRRC